MKKRMFALLLTLCMVVSLLPAQIVMAAGSATIPVLGDRNLLGSAASVDAVFTPNETGTYVFFAENQKDE